MTRQQIEILSPIIQKFSVHQNMKLTEQITYNKSIFENLSAFISSSTNKIILLNCEIIEDYLKTLEKLNESNKKKSILFNPLTFFGIGETMHSFLIAKLINPYSEHGQGKLFLNCFLELIGIEVSENDHWIVTAETGRIDILLKRQYPHTVVVIENKSNYAKDQENQLYRYWYQEIYLPNCYRENAIEYTSNNKNFQIIYLTPADWKIPADHSLQKPTIGYEDFLPITIPIEPKIWLFNKHLVKWLTNSMNELPKENHRLREYVKQYIELWT
ncbi:MAG: PD-(D/E)XK nuclease family protein [Bacteroidota bacterium]